MSAYTREVWREDYDDLASLFAQLPHGNTREIFVWFREKLDDTAEADKRARMWLQSFSFLTKNVDALVREGFIRPDGATGTPSNQLLEALWGWHVVYGRLQGEMPEPALVDILKILRRAG